MYVYTFLHCIAKACIIFISFLLKTNQKKKLVLRANTTGISKKNLFSEHGSGGYSIPPEHCKVVCHTYSSVEVLLFKFFLS